MIRYFPAGVSPPTLVEKVRVATKATSHGQEKAWISEPLLKGSSAAQMHLDKGKDAKRACGRQGQPCFRSLKPHHHDLVPLSKNCNLRNLMQQVARLSNNFNVQHINISLL